MFNNECRMIKIEIYTPASHLEQICEALRLSGAGEVGPYDSALSYSPVKSRWRPLPGANPFNGDIGQLCVADEYKVEVFCPVENAEKAVKAVKEAHPYELPSIYVIPLLYYPDSV